MRPIFHCFCKVSHSNIAVARCLLFLGLLCFCHLENFAQPQVFRFINTNEVMAKTLATSADFADNRQRIEQAVSSYDNAIAFVASRPTVPIVFHILYSNEADMIDVAQIFAQIEALNRDFDLSTGLDEMDNTFAHLKTVPGIRFCLPEFDPIGQPTSGITYNQIAQQDLTVEEALSLLEKQSLPVWDTKRYLNIYVVDMKEEAAGFAQMPGGPQITDAVVINRALMADQVAEDGYVSLGKTLTHLVGNYLNLYSIWGDGSHCSDDRVSDTPIHNAPNYGSPSQGHISVCPGLPLEMVMNFMDFTDDSIRTMFTKGQCQRLYATLDQGGSRSTLLETPIQCGEQMLELVTVGNPNLNTLQLAVFPNPANNIVHIQMLGNLQEGKNVRLDVYSGTGARIFFQHPISEAFSFDCHAWPDGLYVLVFTKNGIRLTAQPISITHK